MRIYCISKTECTFLRLKKKTSKNWVPIFASSGQSYTLKIPKTNKIDNVTAYKALDVRQSKSPWFSEHSFLHEVQEMWSYTQLKITSMLMAALLLTTKHGNHQMPTNYWWMNCICIRIQRGTSGSCRAASGMNLTNMLSMEPSPPKKSTPCQLIYVKF